MKKLNAVKLGVKRETVRNLMPDQLETVAGGNVAVQTKTNDTARCQIEPKA